MKSCTAVFEEKVLFVIFQLASAAVAGGITLNPVVMATLTGVGLTLKAVASLKTGPEQSMESIIDGNR